MRGWNWHHSSFHADLNLVQFHPYILLVKFRSNLPSLIPDIPTDQNYSSWENSRWSQFLRSMARAADVDTFDVKGGDRLVIPKTRDSCELHEGPTTLCPCSRPRRETRSRHTIDLLPLRHHLYPDSSSAPGTTQATVNIATPYRYQEPRDAIYSAHCSVRLLRWRRFFRLCYWFLSVDVFAISHWCWMSPVKRGERERDVLLLYLSYFVVPFFSLACCWSRCWCWRYTS